MSRLSRDLYRKKLDRLLQSADDEPFFIMVWAVRAAQTGHANSARKLIDLPPEAATSDLRSKFAAHPWKCETLLNEVLTVPKKRSIRGQSIRVLNCKNFNTLASLLNALSSLENSEDGIALERISIISEFHRIAQRQFEWQRGFLNLSVLYRSAFIYGGPLTKTFFEETRGITLSDFSLACFGLQTLYYEKPAVLRGDGMDAVGISKTTLDKVYNLVALPHIQARQRAARIRGGTGHTGYKRSLFREYPCIAFGEKGERIHSPLPELLMLRATSGIFYDVVKAPGPVRNEISDLFEAYCTEILQKMLLNCQIERRIEYNVSKNLFESPDIILKKDENISILIECKARRMSYEARFSEDPIAEAPQAYEEVAKGVFQIWRFKSHHRQGYLTDQPMAPKICGVVLTLDTWLSAASSIQAQVLNIANRMADQDPHIAVGDRIPVVFCPVEELEYTLGRASEASFLAAISAAAEPRFQGWALSNVHEQVFPGEREEHEYPFEGRLAEVLPWWGLLETAEAANPNKAARLAKE